MIVKPLAVRVNEHERHILDILDTFQRRQAYFFQRIEAAAGAGRIGGVEPQHGMALLLAPAGRQRPVFALDVQNDGRTGPREQGGQDQAQALAGARGREAQDMFRPVVPEIPLLPGLLVPPAADVHALAGKIGQGLYFRPGGPVGRTVQRGITLLLAGGGIERAAQQQRQDEDDLAKRLRPVQHVRVKRVRPRENGPGRIPGKAAGHEQGLAERGLKAVLERRFFRRRPHGREARKREDAEQQGGFQPLAALCGCFLYTVVVLHTPLLFLPGEGRNMSGVSPLFQERLNKLESSKRAAWERLWRLQKSASTSP